MDVLRQFITMLGLVLLFWATFSRYPADTSTGWKLWNGFGFHPGWAAGFIAYLLWNYWH